MFRRWLSTGSHSAPCWWWPTWTKQLSRVALLQPKHMGHIWAAYGPHMGTWFAAYGAFSTYGEENPSESTTYGQHMGLFFKHMGSSETYRSFLKHMEPFRNIWGLLWKVFVSFSDLPHCIIPVYELFSLSKVLPITNQACSRYFCQRKTSIGSFRESLKPVFYHQSWNWKATRTIFKLILRLRSCQFVCIWCKTS